MENNLMIYEAQIAVCTPSGRNYNLKSPFTGYETKLTRDVDFGVISGTKQPSLLKSGAEKVCMAYGVFQVYDVEHAIETIDNGEPFFFYRVRCDLKKIAENGEVYTVASAYGSANTRERMCGKQSAYDGANSRLKMAQKRALVAAAISLAGISSIFSQDMENENFMANYDTLVAAAQNKTITKQQTQMVYARLTNLGISTDEFKKYLTEQYGTDSVKNLTPAQFDSLIEWFVMRENS